MPPGVGEADLRAEAPADACQTLADAIDLRLNAPSPIHVAAGDDIDISVYAKVRNTAALAPYDNVIVNLGFTNGRQGSRALTQFLEVQSASGGAVTSEFALHHARTDKMMGSYVARAFLTAFPQSGVPCFKPLGLPPTEIVIVNSAASSDIDPPQVTSIHLEPSYRLGDVLELRASVSDASGICTNDDWQSSSCVTEPVAHVWFQASDGTLLNRYLPLLRDPGGELRTSVPLTAGADGFAVGTYRVVGLNVIDIWGNAASDLPAETQSTFRVVTASAIR